MTKDYVDMVVDLGMTASDLNGTNDVTGAFYDAARECRNSGGTKKKVQMPTAAGTRLKVSTQQGKIFQSRDSIPPPSEPTAVVSKGVQQWLGDRYQTQIFLDTVTASQWTNAVVTMFQWDSISNGILEFLLDGRSRAQMGNIDRNATTGGPAGTGNWDAKGNLIGYAVHGLKATNAKHPDLRLSVINTRTVNTNGHAADSGFPIKASAFAIEMIQPLGGTYWCEFGTPDGQIGSECIVFHGASFVTGWQSNPWIITHLRADHMLRGWGCFNGGTGEIHDMVTHDLLKVKNACSNGSPKGYMGAHVNNIEAGKDKGADGGTPGPIKIYAPQSTNAVEFLTNANNYGNPVGEVRVYGLDPAHPSYPRGFSKDDGYGVHYAGSTDADTVGVYFKDFLFDSIKSAIVSAKSQAQLNGTHFDNCKYTPAGTTRAEGGSVPAAWDLTVGTFGNSPPSITAFTPADGATVTPSTPITVTVTAGDLEDTA